MNFRQKSVFILCALFFLVSIFSSCYYDNRETLYPNETCDTTTVSFSADVVPILEANCYVCHSIDEGETSGDGYILETYDELTASTDGVTLIDVIEWTPGGAADMPKSGSQLPNCERAIIHAWINQGMLDN